MNFVYQAWVLSGLLSSNAMEYIEKTSSLNAVTALKLARAGHDHAAAQGWKMAIAVVDQAGNMMAFSRLDGAPAPCTTIALDKAYTAASFKAGTRQLAENLEGEAPRVVAGLTACDRLSLFGGGVPVEISGETVGAVGVSGGSEKQDELCALAAINEIFGNEIFGETEE